SANNSSGGPMATAGGLVFIGATGDRLFRAFDAETGDILWQQRLDYAAQTIPMSYRGKDGKQYVAVVASGVNGAMRGPDNRPLNREGIVAFALPD
ncbi:MAG TPA: PQQ-binding-like beta-propeller repeat protein, partial [Sphingomonadaceae bacterium]|nr:PQQ-binding-like beta-propeller repeat protein [Sphingomonadaceae bacterium]